MASSSNVQPSSLGFGPVEKPHGEPWYAFRLQSLDAALCRPGLEVARPNHHPRRISWTFPHCVRLHASNDTPCIPCAASDQAAAGSRSIASLRTRCKVTGPRSRRAMFCPSLGFISRRSWRGRGRWRADRLLLNIDQPVGSPILREHPPIRSECWWWPHESWQRARASPCLNETVIEACGEGREDETPRSCFHNDWGHFGIPFLCGECSLWEAVA